MGDDWYRLTKWNKKNKADFFTRLQSSRGAINKAQYLRIQASYLQGNYPEEALELLNISQNDYPDPFFMSQIYFQKAKCMINLSRHEEAVELFRMTLQYEKKNKCVITTAYLEFPFFIARNKIQAHYKESQEILIKNENHLTLPAEHYLYNTSMALILWEEGDKTKAKEFANSAIEAADRKTSGFRNHPDVGIVKQQEESIRAKLKIIAGY